MYLHKLRSVALMANLSLTDCSGRRARRMRTQIARAPAIAATRSSSSYRSEEHTSELQSLMRISYAVFCLKKTKKTTIRKQQHQSPTDMNISSRTDTSIENYE